MRAFAVKHWFLCGIVLALVSCLAAPTTARSLLDPISTRVLVALALFLSAWGLGSRLLLRAMIRPVPVLWALAMSYIALPALALLAGVVMERLTGSADSRVGLLLIASVPCTLATAVLCTRAAGGNEATALLVVLVSTAMSWLVTTAWLALTPVSGAGPEGSRLMLDLLQILVIPVGIAQLSRLIPAVVLFAERWRTAVGIVARLIILVVVMKAAVLVADRAAQITFGLVAGVAAACLALHIGVLWLGYAGGRLIRLDGADRRAVAFAGSQKTLPVALYLFDVYYAPQFPLAVLPLALFQLGQLTVDSIIAERLAAPVKALPRLADDHKVMPDEAKQNEAETEKCS
jgi:predicted Na+-dependent transporter